MLAQQSIGSYSAGNATSGRVMPGVGRVTHRSILRCVGLVLLSYVKAQHGQVRSSTGTAKFGQALAKPIKAKRDDVKVELSFVGRCFVQYGTGAVRSSTVQVLFCFVGSRLGFAKCRQRNVWYG